MSSKADTVVKTAMSTKRSTKHVEDPKRALYEYLKLIYSIKIKPKRLRFVTNSQCIGINFQQLRKLQDQTNLQELLLDMQYTGLVIELAVGLASKISKIAQLRKIKLDYTDCPIGSKGFQGVVVKLSRMEQLEDLALIFNQCKIESSAMVHLVERLKNLPQLKSLTLGLRQNQLDNASLETIGEALALCKQLENVALDLSYNNNIINPKAGSLNLERLCNMKQFDLSVQASQIISADFVVLPPCLQELSLNLIRSQPFRFQMTGAAAVLAEPQNNVDPVEPVEEDEEEEEEDLGEAEDILAGEEPIEAAEDEVAEVEAVEEEVAEVEAPVEEDVAEVEAPPVEVAEGEAPAGVAEGEAPAGVAEGEAVEEVAGEEDPIIAEVVPAITIPAQFLPDADYNDKKSPIVSAEELEKQKQEKAQREREFNELADKVFDMSPLLEDLTLHFTFANEGIGKLSEKLSQLKNIKKLSLKNRFGSALNQADVTKLCQFLTKSTELSSIALSFNHSQVTSAEVERIITAICSTNNRRHVKLNISNTPFQGNGPHTVIAQQLLQLTSLESLSLNFSGNNLGVIEGQILELATSLGRMSQLQSLKLNLRSNRILVSESEQISTQIGTLSSLSYLKLSFGVLTSVEINEDGDNIDKDIIDDQPIYKAVTTAVKQRASEITRIQLFDSYHKNFIPFNPYYLICDFYY